MYSMHNSVKLARARLATRKSVLTKLGGAGDCGECSCPSNKRLLSTLLLANNNKLSFKTEAIFNANGDCGECSCGTSGSGSGFSSNSGSKRFFTQSISARNTKNGFPPFKPLFINSIAPNFEAKTTHGPIDFHHFIGNNWVILFSHPADFTPVCTTELGAFAALEDEFVKRGAKLIALSADSLKDHKEWIKDIEETSSKGKKFKYPIIADPSRKISWLYGMLDNAGIENIKSNPTPFTLRSVFIIDPSKKIRLTITYPPSVGRNSAEILRVLDALQLGDKAGVVTPIDWQVGQDVIIPPTVSDETATKKFGQFKKVKPYLRFTSAPSGIKSSGVFDKKYLTPELLWFLLLILFGSQITNYVSSKSDYVDSERSLKAKIEHLKNIIERINKGETINIEEELKNGLNLEGKSTNELIKELEEQEDSLIKQLQQDIFIEKPEKKEMSKTFM